MIRTLVRALETQVDFHDNQTAIRALNVESDSAPLQAQGIPKHCIAELLLTMAAISVGRE